jgi:hypothetical protein
MAFHQFHDVFDGFPAIQATAADFDDTHRGYSFATGSKMGLEGTPEGH